VGEFAVKQAGKLVVRPMYKIDCGDAPPGELVFDASRLADFAALKFVFAAKDWDGTLYKVEEGQLVRESPFVFEPLVVKYAGYPPGSVAIFDSALNKYRILAPAK
jgi:hypothetical protein